MSRRKSVAYGCTVWCPAAAVCSLTSLPTKSFSAVTILATLPILAGFLILARCDARIPHSFCFPAHFSLVLPQDKNRWQTAVRETFEESLKLVDLLRASRTDHCIGDTTVHHDKLVPIGGRKDDQAYKCYLTRLPPSASDHFCTRFAAAAAQMRSSGHHIEVTDCVRFPVANIVTAARRNGRMQIESQKGRWCDIRDRTWKVKPRLQRCAVCVRTRSRLGRLWCRW